VLQIGIALGPVEDIVGRQVDDRDADAMRAFRDEACANLVDREGVVRMRLGVLHGLVGRGRDNDIGRSLPQCRIDALGPGEIELRPAEAQEVHSGDLGAVLPQV
jgi:hypothetical protein